MKDHLTTQLKKLSTIEPDPRFAARARKAVLASRPGYAGIRVSFSFSAFPMWAWSGAALTTLLVGTIVLIPLALPRPTLSASFNAESLSSEYENLPINIQLKEIRYEQTVNQAITSAITEATDTNMKHLNTSLIQSEEKDAALAATEDVKINALLDSVLQ